MDDLLQRCRALTECDGVPGQEHEVRKLMEGYLEGSAQIERDHLGSLIAVRHGDVSGPKLMLAAHLDEVGFLITDITDEGFLRFEPLGGWWDQVMLAQRVRIHTRKGALTGVIGSKPPHVLPAEERKKPVEMKDMFIDIGVASAEEAREAGVRPGDPAVPICPFTPLANDKFLMAKAWDNRAGCVAVLETMRTVGEHPNILYGVATVQEEVGLRGAETSTFAVQPDIGIAVDVCIAGDTPGMKPEEARAKLGKGPCLLLYDRSMVPHRGLRDYVIDMAEAEGIPLQFDSMAGGGTDAGRIHLFGKGVPTVALCVPTRYIHSHAAIIHRDDLENTIRLLVTLVRSLDAATVQEIVDKG